MVQKLRLGKTDPVNSKTSSIQYSICSWGGSGHCVMGYFIYIYRRHHILHKHNYCITSWKIILYKINYIIVYIYGSVLNDDKKLKYFLSTREMYWW